MPAGQHFDERHLQDVVLAQSRQIRPRRRFSALAILNRAVVALAAIIAIAAIALGIKDYVDEQPSAIIDAPTVEHTKAVSRRKKTTSANTESTRMAATEAAAAGDARSPADEMEKPIISEGSADTGAKGANRPNALTAQAHDEAEAAKQQDNGVGNGRDSIGKPGLSPCLPLPNGTQPGDVDAPYYSGWATEYCDPDLNRPSALPKVPQSRQSKR